MNFDSLVRYIKRQGCRVRIYRSKKTLVGSMGTFHLAAKGPIIVLAAKGVPKKKLVEYLLHEYGHFLQWQDGFMQLIDGICDSYNVYEDWINHRIELAPVELKAARNAMLAIEWDAEMRAIKIGTTLGIEHFDPQYCLKGALAYVLCIKWCWKYRKNLRETPKRKTIKATVLTTEKLFSPLTKKEKKLLEKSPKF